MLRADVTAWTDGGGKAKAALNVLDGRDNVARFFAGIYGRETWVRVGGTGPD